MLQSRAWRVVVRLRPGVSEEAFRTELGVLRGRISAAYPAIKNGGVFRPVQLHTAMVGNAKPALVIVMAGALLVLAITCANIAGLFLSRGAARQRELGVRAALGAGRGRLLQQLLFESLSLAAVACAIGVAAGYLGVKALVAATPRQQLPRLDTIQMDGSVVLFSVGLALLTAILSGLVPYFQMSQVDPQQALQQHSGRATSRSAVRRALVVLEVALSLVLLVGAGLMLRSFHRLTSVNPGFQTTRLLTMEMFVSPSRYDETPKRAMYFSRLIDEIRNVPGVQAAGSIHFLPLQERTSGSCFNFPGQGEPDSRSPSAGFLVVSPSYFETMGMPLVAGRRFDSRDRPGSPSTIVVNQEFVREHLKGRNPIGEKLNVCWSVPNPAEVIGVIADARQTSLDAKPRATIFVNNHQGPMYFGQLVVRTAADPAPLQRAIEAAIHRVDPDQAVGHVQTMEAVLSDSVAQPRLQVALLSVFAATAAALAIVGVYGVVAYSAARRVREIGIRMALGAAPGDVRRLLLKEGFVLGGIGILIGLGGALALTRVMRTLLFETEPTDPVTLAGVSCGILAVVFLATILPANRAAGVHPTVALRHE
jgi:putative ABC transport system permease protein